MKTTHSTARPYPHAGFSLIELMVVVGLLAITAALAGPPMTQWIQSNRITSGANSLLADIKYARSEAIRNNSVVSIAPVDGNFRNGWRVTTPSPAGAVVTLKVHEALVDLTQSSRLLVESSSGSAAISFREDGRLSAGSTGTSVTIVVRDTDPGRCSSNPTSNYSAPGCSARILEINAFGRTKVSNPNPFL
jgi:prepilin-type N-terminal cleavage/methylation domain-containing protein